MSIDDYFSKEPPEGFEQAMIGVSYPEYKALKLEPVEGMGEIKTEPMSLLAFGEMFPPEGRPIPLHQQQMIRDLEAIGDGSPPRIHLGPRACKTGRRADILIVDDPVLPPAEQARMVSEIYGLGSNPHHQGPMHPAEEHPMHTYATSQDLTATTATAPLTEDAEIVTQELDDTAGILEKAFGKPRNRKQQRRLDQARRVTVGMFLEDKRVKEEAKEKRRKKAKETAKAKARNRKR